MKKKTKNLQDGEWHSVKTYEDFRWECCDCGLTHKVVLKIINKSHLKLKVFRLNKGK